MLSWAWDFLWQAFIQLQFLLLVAPLKLFPVSMGVLLMMGGIGSIIMPIVFGALSDSFGILAGMSAIIFAIVMMIGFVLINVFRIKEK